MTSRRFSPFLLRRDILSPEIRHTVETALAQTDWPLEAILVSFWFDEGRALPCFAPRFAVRTGHDFQIVAWQDIDAPTGSMIAIADAGMCLMGSDSFQAQVGQVSVDTPFARGHQFYTAQIRRDSIILSHDNIGSYAQDHESGMRGTHLSDEIRAQICTIILPEQGSAHAAVDERRRVVNDLEIFRDTAHSGLSQLKMMFDLDLTDPTALELASAPR